MNILTILRPENTSLVAEFVTRGHTVWATPQHAQMFRQRHVPVEWVEGWQSPAERGSCQDAIDLVLDYHARMPIDALVVWTDATPYNRAAVLAAKKLGILTFEVTHGALNTYRQGHFECESYVDVILAPGQEEIDFRRFYGQKVTVEPVGKPAFDWIHEAKQHKLALRQELKKSLSLPSRRPIVIYGMTWRHPFSTWERDPWPYGGEAVFAAHMNLQSVCAPFLVVKPHPTLTQDANHVTWLKDMLERAGVQEYAITTADSSLVLPAADLVVSHKSSLLVEGVLLDTPCLGIDFRERNDFDFYRGRGIEWVGDPERLLPGIVSCLLDSNTKQRLAEERFHSKHYFNGPNDGRAAEGCVTEVERYVTRIAEVKGAR